MKLSSLAIAALVAVLVAPAAHASTLTIYDNYQGDGVTQNASVSSVAWTLVTQDNCTTCSVLLTASFNGTNNYYAGTYLDSVQWVVSQPNISPTSVGYDGFYVNGGLDPQWNQQWGFAIGQSLNANQCNGSSSGNHAICGEWLLGGTGGGYGTIQTGSHLAWAFQTTFNATLTQAVTGNIRGAFNTANGRNYNIFSPGGGSFTSGGCTNVGGCAPPPPPPPPVPEPAGLVLTGTGLMFVAYRLRRR